MSLLENTETEEKSTEKLQDQLRAQNFYLAVLAIIGIGYILQLTQSFMIPFVIAVLLGVLLSPVLVYLHEQGIPESWGSLIIFVGIFLVLTVFSLLLYSAGRSVSEDVGKYKPRVQEIVTNVSSFTEVNFGFSIKEEISKSEGRNLFSLLNPSSVINTINKGLGSFFMFFSDLLVMLLFLMFILLSRKFLKEKIYSFMCTQGMSEDKSEDIVNSIAAQIQAYLWLKTLISVGTGLAVWLTATLFGLDFPIVWGFLAFVLNYIPSIGPILASIPPVLLAFFQFYDHIWIASVVSVLLVSIQFASGNIVEPKIMGDRLNLNILVVLLCLFVWGVVWGFVGMILSVPLTASLNIILSNSNRHKHISILLSNQNKI